MLSEQDQKTLERDLIWLAGMKDAGHCGEGNIEAKWRQDWNDRIDRLLNAARQQGRGERKEPTSALAHAYDPDKRYPWFCAQCGYPESGWLQHAAPAPEGDGASMLDSNVEEDQ